MRTLLSLGSNLGDRVDNLLQARSELGLLGEITNVAPLYETSPVGEVVQDNFINTAIMLDTTLSPIELLEHLHRIEAALGRIRDVHWGPRTLDIDIVDCEGFSSQTEQLHIPHQYAHERRFVLQPVVDIAPTWLLNHVSVSNLLQNLSGDDQVNRYHDERWQVNS
jgi:2-amino-4-hydroxy-6-hydroxymethyldihydropteridine diphosphokinase